MVEYWSVVSLPTANASPSAHVQPFEPGQARKETSAIPAAASVGLEAATETVAPFLIDAPPARCVQRERRSAGVTSRVIVRPWTVFAFRSVTVV